jgi:hypothetical protein
MNESEYIAEVKKIKIECRARLKALWNDFALEHNRIKVGDIVGFSGYNVIVDKIEVSEPVNWSYPNCKYLGRVLTKKGVPHKNGKQESFGASHIQTVNGEVYDHETTT